MRKFRLFLIAMILVLAIFMLVGCGDGSQNDASGKNKIGPTFTLSDDGDGYELSSYKFGDETDVVIQDTYEGLPVVAIGANVFSSSKLTSITIPSTVKRISTYAFAYCENLESIVIPDSVTYIGRDVFRDSGLKSIAIGNGLKTVEEDAFVWCNDLQSVYISDLSKWCEITFTRNMSSGATNSNPLEYAHNLYLNGELVEDAVIPSDVTSIKDYAFQGASFKSISIPDSVTSIGIYAFSNCDGLTNVVVPDSVTTIGEGAFFGCSNLESMTIPFVGDKAGVKSGDKKIYPFGYIFGNVFAYENSVKVTQRKKDEYSAGLSYARYYLPSKLTSVTVTGGDILSYAFEGCTNITEIICGENVTSVAKNSVNSETGWYNTFEDGEAMYMGKILYGCKGDNLPTCQIGVEDGTVGFAEGAFDNSNLEIIELPSSIKFVTGLNTKSLKQIRVQSLAQWCGYDFTLYTSPFYNNSELELCLPGGYLNTEWKRVSGTVTIPDGVTKIGNYAFAYYDYLAYLRLPDTLTSIGEGAFYECRDLISIQRFGSGVRSVGKNAFMYCTSLLSVAMMNQTVLDNWCSIDFANEYSTPLNGTTSNDARGLFWINKNVISGDETWTAVKDLEISDGVTSINDYAFRYCTNLQSVTIPSSVTSIGKRAFGACNALHTVNFNGSISIKEGAFNGCRQLSKVNVSKIEDWLGMSFETTNNNHYAYPFYSYMTNNTGDLNNATLCIDDKTVTEITVPDTVTSIGDYAFYGLRGLTSVTFSDSVTSIGMCAFKDCSGLTSITIPDSVTSIGANAFEDCYGVKSITIGKGLTSAEEVFVGCASELETITVSAENTKLKSVGNCLIEAVTLYGDENEVLGEIGVLILGCANSVIPDDGSVKRIGSSAFEGCNFDSPEITIPVSVEEIDNFAFWAAYVVIDPDIYNLQINYTGTMEQWNACIYPNESLDYIKKVVCTDGTITYIEDETEE